MITGNREVVRRRSRQIAVIYVVVALVAGVLLFVPETRSTLFSVVPFARLESKEEIKSRQAMEHAVQVRSEEQLAEQKVEKYRRNMVHFTAAEALILKKNYPEGLAKIRYFLSLEPDDPYGKSLMFYGLYSYAKQLIEQGRLSQAESTIGEAEKIPFKESSEIRRSQIEELRSLVRERRKAYLHAPAPPSEA